jgi:hypothetical protein
MRLGHAVIVDGHQISDDIFISGIPGCWYDFEEIHGNWNGACNVHPNKPLIQLLLDSASALLEEKPSDQVNSPLQRKLKAEPSF